MKPYVRPSCGSHSAHKRIQQEGWHLGLSPSVCMVMMQGSVIRLLTWSVNGFYRAGSHHWPSHKDWNPYSSMILMLCPPCITMNNGHCQGNDISNWDLRRIPKPLCWSGAHWEHFNLTFLESRSGGSLFHPVASCLCFKQRQYKELFGQLP